MLSFKEGLQFVSSENQGLPHGPPPKEDGDNNNNNNDDDSEDYAHDNYLSHLISRQQHRERVLIGELEAVKRENKLIQSIRSLRRERDTLLEKERAWQQERLTLTNKLRKFRPETSLPVGGKDAAEAAPVTSLLEPEQAVSAPSDIQEGVYKPAQPKLNYVDWPIFKSLRKRSEGDSFAIDVLQGEPDDEPIIAVHLSQPLVPERIRINSRHIIRILDHISGEALSAYGGSVVMTRPFKFLAYYKEAIQQKFSELKHRFESDNTSVTQQLASDANAETGFVDSNGDEFTESLVAYEQLRCLIAFMDAEVRLKVHHHSWGGGKAVAFADMWYLFKPGDEVTSRDCRQVYRVVGTSSPGHPVLPSWNGNDIETNDKMVKTAITLRCVYIDFDGNQLGPVSQVFQITPFDGTRAITSLEVFPIRYADHIDHQELITRGRRFLHALNAKYMYYTGRTIEPQETVHSHVVVDFEAALARDHGGVDGGWQPKIQSILGHTTLPKIADRVCRGACCLGENVYRDNDFDAKRNQEYIARMVSEDVTVSQPPSLILHPKPLHVLQSESGPADSELVVTTYRVLGFILKSRRWAQLDVDCLTITTFSESLFDRLVLPSGYKEMILSSIAQHYQSNSSSLIAEHSGQDIIRGTGTGLIILLHGPPGVGKTTTVEAAAHEFKKPLMTINCGDVGTHPAEVERFLETIFELAKRWDCVLLLQEADVFLSAREAHDVIRSGLVAVFLRVLEYYTGLLFLTTNRIGHFDQAFASRIHLTLPYPQLDLDSTLAIFTLSLQLIQSRFKMRDLNFTIDWDDVIRFARAYWTNNEFGRWNGRQIRNNC